VAFTCVLVWFWFLDCSYYRTVGSQLVLYGFAFLVLVRCLQPPPPYAVSLCRLQRHELVLGSTASLTFGSQQFCRWFRRWRYSSFRSAGSTSRGTVVERPQPALSSGSGVR
jgi:hypothetical protein